MERAGAIPHRAAGFGQRNPAPARRRQSNRTPQPHVTMDRHFLVPATIAAALHAGLLFGIRPSKTAAVASEPKPPVIDFVKKVVEFIVDSVPPEGADRSAPPRPADAAPPVLPELPAAQPVDAFPMPPPAVPGPASLVPVTTIPPGPFGPASDLPTGPGVGPGGVWKGTDLDRTPRTRSQTPPAYPFEAKKDGRSGTVTVEFVVDETGAVLTPRITDSTDAVFNDSALRAIARWRFEPGRKDGRVVRFRMAVPVVFSLNPE